MSATEIRTCMGCMSETDNAVCPVCGCDSAFPSDKNLREPGAVLAGRFLLGIAHHQNGESVTYVGKDNQSGRRVWIQEYFPRKIACRDLQTGFLVPKADRGAQYKALLSDFMDLCDDVRRLSIGDPVVPLLHMISENNTLYAVFQDLGVISLEQYLSENGNRLDEPEATALLLPLFHAVANMHDRGVIHRGLSPETIYIDPNGKLYIAGFALSATRTAQSELECELFNGYSAPEQHSPSGWQGTWSDVYALAAIYYRTVSGIVPPKSVWIGNSRQLPPLAELMEGVPSNVSDAIADAMQLQPSKRTQTAATLAGRMTATDSSSTMVYDATRIPAQDNQQPPPGREEGEPLPMKRVWILSACVIVLLVGILAFVMTRSLKNPSAASASASRAQQGTESNAQTPADTSASSELPPDSKVPNFAGVQLQEVQNNEEYRARFIFEVEEHFSDLYDAGVIIDQLPRAGANMPNRGTLILYVSKGAQVLTMPELSGLTAEEVMQALAAFSQENEISPSLSFEAYQIYSADALPDTVVRTSPVAGAEFSPSTEVIQVFFAIKEQTAESTQRGSSHAASSSNASPWGPVDGNRN
jgi:Uncharacterized protein conserved in bacteria